MWELVGQESSSVKVVLCFKEGKEQSVVGGQQPGSGGGGYGKKMGKKMRL